MSWIREGNHDKAWNDPPVFAYDAASAAQATHKRTSLNKRVAFPVSGSAGQAPSLAPGQGPPPMMPGQGPPPLKPGLGPPPMMPGQGPPPLKPGQGPPPVMPGQGPPPKMSGEGSTHSPCGQIPEATSQQESNVPVMTATEIKTKLLSILDGLEKIEEKLKDDIGLRVDVLCCVLDANRLSSPVQQRLSQLVAALEGGSVSSADRLQRALMVDYPSECGSWMPGIRQLILQLSPLAEPTVPSTPTDTPTETPTDTPADTSTETPADS